MPDASHPYHKLVLIEAGRGQLHLPDHQVDLGAGTWIRIPAHAKHRFADHPDRPMALAILCLTSAACRRFDQHGLWTDLQPYWPTLEALHAGAYHHACCSDAFSQLIHEMGGQRPGRSQAILAWAGLLLVRMLRGLKDRLAHQASPSGMPAILAYLEDHFTQPVRVADLACRAGVSYRTFTAHFRQHTGLTVTAYLHQRRIAFAQQRLVATGDILGTAYDAGFADLAHFYRMFKRVAGQTPRQYMMQQLGD